MKISNVYFFIILTFLLTSTVCHAATLKFTPVTIVFSPNKNTASFEIENQDNEPIILQLKTVKWTQDISGIDHYQDNADLLVTPQVFEIPPKQKQIIRLALLRSINRNNEQAYRLIIQEVINKQQSIKKGLHLSMRFRLPVFIAPIQEPDNNDKVTTQFHMTNKSQMNIVINNNLRRHINLREIQFENKNHQVIASFPEHGEYILAKQSKPLMINAAPEMEHAVYAHAIYH